MAYSSFIIVSLLLSTGFAVVVKINSCGNDQEVCRVSEVRIDPCPHYSDKCFLKKGHNGTMSFDFTPNFTATKLTTNAYWDNGIQDLPFPDLGSDDGCIYSTCPTEAGKSQVFNYNLNIGRKLPNGIFVFKWKVWDSDNDLNTCCFTTAVKISK